MQNLHNIEKSGFRRGEYVGYANGVYRIRKTNSTYGNWIAYEKQGQPTAPTIYAFTLATMSRKLEAVERTGFPTLA